MTESAARWRSRIVGEAELSPSELVANPANWRTHPKGQQDALAAALDTVGWVQRVIVNRQTGHMVDGHLRAELAAREGEHAVPVLYVDLSPDEEALVLASLDPLGAMAATDKDALTALLASISADSDPIRDLLGSVAEQNRVAYGPPPAVDPGPQLDRADELRAKWGTERGQLWEIPSATTPGRAHRLLCGDSSEPEEMAAVLGDTSPAAVITDPPYSFGLSSTSEMANKSGGWHDLMNNASWFTDRYRQWARLVGKGPLWVFSNWRTLPVLMRAAFDAKVGIESLMVWHKDWIGPGGMLGLRPSYELICLTVLGGYGIPDRGIPDLVTVPWASHKPHGHNAEKPADLLVHLLDVSACENVLDPFLGSGTTLVAAEQTGRLAYGLEISAPYCAVALERLAGLGLEPRRG